jgi:hypothetical protein
MKITSHYNGVWIYVDDFIWFSLKRKPKFILSIGLALLLYNRLRKNILDESNSKCCDLHIELESMLRE